MEKTTEVIDMAMTMVNELNSYAPSSSHAVEYRGMTIDIVRHTEHGERVVYSMTRQLFNSMIARVDIYKDVMERIRWNLTIAEVTLSLRRAKEGGGI